MIFGITMIIYELFSSALPGFVNTCLYCSFVSSGYRERDVYCIYENKKTNVKNNPSVITKSSRLLECANLRVQMYSPLFGGA